MPYPAANGQLSALVALIADATKVVEAHFAKSSKPFVPSLNDTEPHPLDIMSDSMELRLAIQTIEGACAQLTATVARPSHTVHNKALAMVEPACLDIIAAHAIPDLLQERPESQGMHVSEISQRTGLHHGKIERIMRFLSTKHVFREISDGVFVNNRLSVQLLSTNSLVSSVRYNTEEVLRAVPFFNEVLSDNEWGHSIAPNHAAFNKSTGYPKSLFEYYRGLDCPIGAKLGIRFDTGMAGWGLATEGLAAVYEYPWKDLPPGSTVVDVGSGVGSVAVELAKQYPTLKLTLQDLPERMVQAKEDIWPRECPQAISENRVRFEALNFFAESPVAGADIYYLRHIIHDWDDERSVEILKNVRKAMGRQSRILIHEYILQDIIAPSDDGYIFQKAPEPLLPNYGVGRLRPYSLDISMMLMTNSSERRLNAFLELAEEADLVFVKLWDVGETSIIELMSAV